MRLKEQNDPMFDPMSCCAEHCTVCCAFLKCKFVVLFWMTLRCTLAYMLPEIHKVKMLHVTKMAVTRFDPPYPKTPRCTQTAQLYLL